MRHFNKVLERGEAVTLFGVESHFTPDILDSIERIGAIVSACVVTDHPQWNLAGISPITICEIDAVLLEGNFFISRNNPSGLRKSLVQRAIELGFKVPVTLIDPKATVSRSASIGSSVFVGAQAVIASAVTLSHGVYINRLAGVGHHTFLGDFVSVGPGANICSKINIGAGTTIGAGASIAPGIKIGSNSVISAGAVVLKDIPSNVVVLGNPGRIVKEAIVGHMGYSV